MFQGFSKNRQFNGFPRKGFGNGTSQWNGFPCDFWLDAGQAIFSNVDGQRVDIWVDSISNTRWVQTVLNSRPFYRSTDPAFNNLPVIENGFLRSLENQSVFKTGSGNCIAFVAQATVIPGNRNTLFTFGTNNGEISLGGTTERRMGVYNGATPVFASTTLNSTNPLIMLISKNRILINGSFETISGAQASELLSATVFNRIFGNDGGIGFAGKLAEVLCFPFDPTDTQMTEVSNLLNAKYAIY